MKNLLFGLIAMLLCTLGSFAQEVSKVIEIPKGTNSTFLFRGGQNEIFDLKILNGSNATFEPIFNSQLFTKLRVELYAENNSLVTSYIDEKGISKGPNSNEVDFNTNELPFESYTVEKAEVWPLVVAVALCCVSASVGSGGWSVSFSCGCLGNRQPNNNELTINGKKFKASRINFVPLDGNGKVLPVANPGNYSISLK